MTLSEPSLAVLAIRVLHVEPSLVEISISTLPTVPVVDHVTVSVAPPVQFSPPSGLVSVIVGTGPVSAVRTARTLLLDVLGKSG